MSRGVVLNAERPGNNSAAVGMVAGAEATGSSVKCILLYAPLAARTPRSPSSLETGGRCIALTATLKRGGRDKGLGFENNGQLGMVPGFSLINNQFCYCASQGTQV